MTSDAPPPDAPVSGDQGADAPHAHAHDNHAHGGGDSHAHDHDHGHAHGPDHGPGHDHGECVSGALARVEKLCTDKGLRLTPLRRSVMQVLAESHVPLGAYEIVERLGDLGDKPPPMSVYRVLDFLVSEGLAHRIESRNAFLACGHPHEPDDVVVFLICEQCGSTREVGSHAVGRDLAWAARSAGFEPRQRVLDVAGCCAHCREQGAATADAGQTAG